MMGIAIQVQGLVLGLVLVGVQIPKIVSPIVDREVAAAIVRSILIVTQALVKIRIYVMERIEVIEMEIVSITATTVTTVITVITVATVTLAVVIMLQCKCRGDSMSVKAV